MVVGIRVSSWYKKTVVDIDVGNLLTSLLCVTQRDDKSEQLQLTCNVGFLVNDQRDAQILFYVFISIYNSLHVSSTSCSSSRETNCINTASGNSHSMLVTEMCAGWKKSFSNLHTSRPPA